MFYSKNYLVVVVFIFDKHSQNVDLWLSEVPVGSTQLK